MKKKFGYVLGILLLISSLAFSQVKDEPKVVILPDDIAAKVIDELIVKDHLVFELQEKDSIIVAYELDINNLKVEVGMYKLNEVDFNTIIAKEREKTALKDKELRKANLKLLLGRIQKIGLAVLATAELIVILVLSTK